MENMIEQTILQETSGITTQKLILCAILLPSGFAQAQADEAPQGLRKPLPQIANIHLFD
jgi:hypothetical protein